MEAVLSALQLLAPAGQIELRALSGQHMEVERFERHAQATAWAARMDARQDTKAVYVVMNAYDPARVKGAGVTDSAVTARRWLLVDVDPERPVDTNASRDEMALAVSVAKGIEEYLGGLGWPEPVRALSGNGAHLLYRIDLPNDPGAKALVDGVLRHLSARFSTDSASVDTTVSNAARITKLYGTKSRKGPHSEERPQRASRITRVPEPLAVVGLSLLEAVAAKVIAAKPAPLRFEDHVNIPGQSAYDLGDVLSKVAVLNTKQRDGATWHLIKCPWSFEHSGTDGEADAGIVVQPDGAMGFKCLHAHCVDRRWEAFRDHLAIDTKRWKEGARKPVPVLRPAPVREREPGEDDEEPQPTNPRRVTVGAHTSREALLKRMDMYAFTGAMPGAIPSGMKRLDGMLLGGFRPGKFYVLGGETGRGKTTLLMQWALHAAPRIEPGSVGIVTPEMDEDSLNERLLSARTGIGLADYRKNPNMAREEWERCMVPQNIRASFDADDIASFVAEEKLGMLIVDYAQQAVSYDNERRHTALAMLGGLCLDISKQYRIPVLLGTQVNVTAERDFSIRETRILEHQADAVVYIDITYDKQTDAQGRRQIKSQSLLVHKNRHGYAGRIPIDWQDSLFRFSEAL